VKVRVLVRLKAGILDVQGAAVKRALAGLGFAGVADLRVGKVIDVELLAKPVLEDYTIETGGDLAPRGGVR
jgi:phosphoribosylformylglycinamidine (FGAM) synthase PurS component